MPIDPFDGLRVSTEPGGQHVIACGRHYSLAGIRKGHIGRVRDIIDAANKWQEYLKCAGQYADAIERIEEAVDAKSNP